MRPRIPPRVMGAPAFLSVCALPARESDPSREESGKVQRMRGRRSKSARAKFPSSALPKQKATCLPNLRSLVGVPVLFLVGKYRTKEGRKKITHVPSILAVGVKLVTSPFSAIFINTIPGILIDRGLRYRPSRVPRRAIAKTPVD